jgi:uncharacterized protein YndB with AHSA1/START domain
MTIALISIAAIIALLLIVAALQSNWFAISRDITINRPVEEVFEYIRHIKNMEHYNKWVMTDPNQKTAFTGTDGQVGFIYAWDSENKNAGKGEQEIKQIVLNQKIQMEIRFEKPFKGVSEAIMTTEPATARQTKVTYTFQGAKNFGMKIAHMLFGLEKILGKDLDTTMQRLKTQLEK